MSTPRRPTEERRTEIADAALRIIGTRGIAALTVASLAAELGLSGGALYRHFPSTDAILEAVAARAAELFALTLPPPDLPPRAWLEQFAEVRTATVGGHAGLSRLMLSDQFLFALPAPAIEKLAGAVRETRAAIVNALARGQAAGAFRDDATPEELAPIVMGTLQMIAMHRSGSVLPRITGDPRGIVRTLLQVLAPTRSKKAVGR